MNTRRKGNRAELRAQRWLEERGWLVYRARQSRFRTNDIFGLFDLLAVPPETVPARRLLLIQVGAVASIQDKQDRILACDERIRGRFDCEVWRWVARGPKRGREHFQRTYLSSGAWWDNSEELYGSILKS